MREANGDGTFKLTTTVRMRFERRDDGEKFRCVVQPQPGRGNKVTEDRKIFVRCKRFYCTRNANVSPPLNSLLFIRIKNTNRTEITHPNMTIMS